MSLKKELSTSSHVLKQTMQHMMPTFMKKRVCKDSRNVYINQSIYATKNVM
jgi:hypothetical protein